MRLRGGRRRERRVEKLVRFQERIAIVLGATSDRAVIEQALKGAMPY
ncbi:hypothetical protein [Rubidibacter lacunae]|nr:hypothetical protein [Rubidibacter lacunae]